MTNLDFVGSNQPIALLALRQNTCTVKYNPLQAEGKAVSPFYPIYSHFELCIGIEPILFLFTRQVHHHLCVQSVLWGQQDSNLLSTWQLFYRQSQLSNSSVPPFALPFLSLVLTNYRGQRGTRTPNPCGLWTLQAHAFSSCATYPNNRMACFFQLKFDFVIFAVTILQSSRKESNLIAPNALGSHNHLLDS